MRSHIPLMYLAIVASGCGRVDQPTVSPHPSVPAALPQTTQSQSARLLPEQSTSAEKPLQHKPQTLTEQLKAAEGQLVEAEFQLQTVRQQSLTELHETQEYRDAEQVSDQLEEKVKSMRADKSPRLADTSKQWMAAKNVLTKLIHEQETALKGDPAYLAASTEVANLKKIVSDLRDAIRQEATRIVEEKRRQEFEQRVVEAPRPSSGSSSGGSVHVKGYYRKDGTYVQPHTRRK